MHKRILVILAMLAMGAPAWAQGISGPPYIAVQGQAQREVVPDVFPLAIDITETSMDADAAQNRVEALARQVIALAEGRHSGNAKINVANLSISPNYHFDRDTGKRSFLGNSYRRSIWIEFTTLDGLRDMLAALPEDKALNIDTRNFSSSRAEQIKRELTVEAIDDARATAIALAKGVGRNLGSVHTISTRGFNLDYSTRGQLPAPAAPPAPTALREGTVTLSQKVYIVYALEGATE